MKKLNEVLRCNKLMYYDHCGLCNQSYFYRGKDNRDANLFFNDVLLHSRWYHSIKLIKK